MSNGLLIIGDLFVDLLHFIPQDDLAAGQKLNFVVGIFDKVVEDIVADTYQSVKNWPDVVLSRNIEVGVFPHSHPIGTRMSVLLVRVMLLFDEIQSPKNPWRIGKTLPLGMFQLTEATPSRGEVLLSEHLRVELEVADHKCLDTLGIQRMFEIGMFVINNFALPLPCIALANLLEQDISVYNLVDTRREMFVDRLLEDLARILRRLDIGEWIDLRLAYLLAPWDSQMKYSLTGKSMLPLAMITCVECLDRINPRRIKVVVIVNDVRKIPLKFFSRIHCPV
mmetsp:Transcript_24908/g.59142  ORF Transcript_24908/g.59142 Transcript_24908/m.59142 type:complete len:280 (+) Transcript_24908:597-1436(+)